MMRNNVMNRSDQDKIPVVIMAGGKGTRIASVNSEVPKPMIEILGKPILEYQIQSLKEQGYTHIILVIGHLGNIIQDYFKNGEKFGVSIEYIIEKEPLGTAGSLYYLKDKIKDDFLLINGDIIFDIDIERFYTFHKEKGGLATLFTHPNDHPYDSGIIISDEAGKVLSWLHKEDERLWYKNRVNAGLHILSAKILKHIHEAKKIDLDRDVLKPLIKKEGIYAYASPEYVKDMGTPDRYFEVTQDIQKGKVKSKNLKEKQKAIFLDRDGTINEYVGFLKDINDFKLIDGVAGAIQAINRSGYLAIVVTNQPVIARGEVTEKELDEIHNKMETLLGEKGAYVDAIYYCPHHPNKGYEGERSELKFDCNCRKPKPGMLLEAAEEYNIDLSQSWMIGDSENDVLAGKAAGCHTVLLNTEKIDSDINIKADFSEKALKQVIDKILEIKMLNNKLDKHIELLIERYPKLESVKEKIYSAYLLMEEAYKADHKLLIAGNGGSAADSEHMVGELMKGFKLKRKPDEDFAKKLVEINEEKGKVLSEKLQGGLPAIALSNHPALSTAYLNDVDGNLIYAQQVYGYGKKGDVFIGITTSGNAENIYNAAIVAKAIGMKVIGLTGEKEGRLNEIADIVVNVLGTETYMIQELHLPVYHCWCLMLEDIFFGQ